MVKAKYEATAKIKELTEVIVRLTHLMMLYAFQQLELLIFNFW